MAQLVVIGTSAVLAAISAAAVPSAGLVVMVMLMQASPQARWSSVSVSHDHCAFFAMILCYASSFKRPVAERELLKLWKLNS